MTPSVLPDPSCLCQGILPRPAHAQWMDCAPTTLTQLVAKACKLIWDSEEDKQALALASLVRLAESVPWSQTRAQSWPMDSAVLGLAIELQIGKGLSPDPEFDMEPTTMPQSSMAGVLWEHLDASSVSHLTQQAALGLPHKAPDDQIMAAALPLVVAQAVVAHNSTCWYSQVGEHRGEPVFVHLRIWPQVRAAGGTSRPALH